MTPAQEAKLKLFLEDIRENLPEVHQEMEACLDEFDGFAPSKMFERFSELTNKAMRNRDEQTLHRHLRYMSKKLASAEDVVFEMIDVYYVESLIWNVPESEARWAWKEFPENIKALYIKIWGKPHFL